MISNVWLDLRSSLRYLRRSPGFTTMVVLMLALGSGAVALMFSVVYSVLLRPLPYPESDRLVKINPLWQPGREGGASLPNFRDWRSMNHTFTSMAAYAEQNSSLQTSSGDSTRIEVIAATADFFTTLRVRPMKGRTFAQEDDAPGKPCTLVLSASVWTRYLSGDADVVGRPVRLDGKPCIVIGVMPGGFVFPPGEEDVAWVTLPPSAASVNRGTGYLSVIGRMKPKVTLHEARTDMDRVARDLIQAYPEINKGSSIHLISYLESITGDTRMALWGLIGAVVLVQLIICSNLGNIQLARALVRSREVAIRMAIGARRWQIARQLFVENFVLALAGAGVGLLLARWTLLLFGRFAWSVVPRAAEIRAYPQVWFALFVAAAATAVLFGLAPMLQLRRLDIETALRATTRTTVGRGHAWTREVLVIGQLALAVVLVTGSFVLLRSLYGLLRQDMGFSAEHVLIMNTSIVGDRYHGRDLMATVYGPQLDRIRHLPGVESAGLLTYLPLGYGHAESAFKFKSNPEPDIHHWPQAAINAASEGSFQVLKIPLLAGRFFDEHDDLNSTRVAIVNDAFVERYCRGEIAVGRQIVFSEADFMNHPLTIVGVVHGSRQQSLTEPSQQEIYISARQIAPVSFWSQFLLSALSTYVVRTSGNSSALAGAVRAAIRDVDSEQVLFHTETMENVVSDFVEDRRLSLALLAVFAGIALLVATAGLYAMLAYTVQQRRPDIAVRMALGAQKKDILRLIVGRALVLNIVGIALGVGGAMIGGRLLASMFFDTRAWDPITLLATCGVLVFFTLPAALIPALRAASLDVVTSLRSD